jgi:four helix bundle protein
MNTLMGRDFKKLDIYHLAYDLVLSIYKLLGNFPPEESNNLVSQLRRCASSIPLNIAEGSGSHSNRVHLTYLGYAYKSSKELEVILDLSLDLGFIPAEEHVSLLDKLEELRAKLYRYMQQVEKEIKENRPNFEYYRDVYD